MAHVARYVADIKRRARARYTECATGDVQAKSVTTCLTTYLPICLPTYLPTGGTAAHVCGYRECYRRSRRRPRERSDPRNSAPLSNTRDNSAITRKTLVFMEYNWSRGVHFSAEIQLQLVSHCLCADAGNVVLINSQIGHVFWWLNSGLQSLLWPEVILCYGDLKILKNFSHILFAVLIKILYNWNILKVF